MSLIFNRLVTNFRISVTVNLKKIILLFFFLTTLCSPDSSLAYKEGSEFPGKGNYADWQKAMNLYIDGYKSPDDNVKRQVSLVAIKIYPYDAAFWNGLALATKDPREQIGYALKATELNPEFSDAWGSLGNAYLALEEYAKATIAWKKQLELDPTAVDTLIAIGSNYINLKKYKDAIPYFDKAIALDPNNYPAYLDRGEAYVYLGNTTKAMDDELVAQKLKPDDPGAYLNIGLIYKKQKNMKLAKFYYTKGLSLTADPNVKRGDIELFNSFQ